MITSPMGVNAIVETARGFTTGPEGACGRLLHRRNSAFHLHNIGATGSLRRRMSRVRLTLFTTLVDFHKPGDIEVFIDEASVRFINNGMVFRKGYLDGKDMASSFRLLPVQQPDLALEVMAGFTVKSQRHLMSCSGT